MSAGADLMHQLARVLSAVLDQALNPAATHAAFRAARDMTQVLGLAGLDRVLAELVSHAGRAWPPLILPLLGRVQALAKECEAVGSVEPMLKAERELSAMAEQIAQLQGEGASGAEGRPASSTLTLAEVLEDLPLADDASRERAGRIRVTAPVAAALRAALDWLEQESPTARPLRLSTEESVVEVICSQVNVAGLRPAEKVLSAVGGVLVPAEKDGTSKRATGTWIVRVPSFTGRNSHLMIQQGELQLALPWHSVLRLCMVPALELEGGFGGLGHPVLEPLTALTRQQGEYPVILIGHGLKRAYLVADRLVWRLEAEPADAPGQPPAPGLARAVRTEDGELHWVLEPVRALAPVEAPPVPYETKAQKPRKEPLPLLRPDEVESLEEQPSAAAAGDPTSLVPPSAEALPAPAVVVEPKLVPQAEAPLPVSEPKPVAPPDPNERTRRSGPLRALIAEDSIAARVFLSRMLEREGFDVRAVTTATELFDELVDESWSLVCVDVELPDGQEDVLARVRERLERNTRGTPLVALVRDAADVNVAAAMGVTHTLLKPFEAQGLKTTLAALSLRSGPKP